MGEFWGKVGLLGLDPRDQDKVERYRAILENQILGHTRFTIYPKDGLEKKGNISVLLRENFRSLKPEWLPSWIMTRTRKLKGSLQVTHVKQYASTDVAVLAPPKKVGG